jgi:predicted RNA binding protein YcfA (HicA-like mRNA interferase family)
MLKGMTQIAKLYANLLANPRLSISFRDFERLLRAFGLELARTNGSHRQYVHPKLLRPFPVQPDRKDAMRYQVREFLELVEEHGLYLDE